MKKFNNLLLVALLFISATVLGQTKLTGKVVDEMGEPLPGASVMVKGTSNGTATDFDGNFKLTVQTESGVLVVSFVGYNNKEVSFTSGNVGTIELAPANVLEEVVIVGTGIIDLAKDRQTPVAVSTIKAAEIQAKAGNQEFPEILRSTPSVYVTKQGGGFGDSRINLRGFDQSNTAFLLNGQPINGMEDGKMYWSNWSGVMDVANAVQIQRGLGSSKLAISSVGGTVNIVTKSTDRKEGGFVKGLVGNDAYYKGTVGYSTGKDVDSPWGVTALFTHWQGDGYNDGTKGQGQNYFISLGYELNENHNLNFLITGAPQWHDNNFSKSIETYLEKGRKFNNNWGYENGSYKTERRNFYHKPVANLNWDWTINDKASLSTVLYASWGRGGGTGRVGGGLDSADRYDANGQVDFDALRAHNATIAGGIGRETFRSNGYALRASVNNHQWYGIVSNFNLDINENWSWNIGVDGRHYKGDHYRNIVDFLGLQGMTTTNPGKGDYTLTESFEANPWKAIFNPNNDRKQRYAWDYEEKIQYLGGFSQIEFKNENMSAYLQGAISTQGHQRWDYHNYADADDIASEKVNNTGYNVKGGMNFKFDEQNNFFMNMGYYSRQPFHDNIYLNFRNDVDPDMVNEKVTGLEMGYAHRGEKFATNVNLYYTVWKNRANRNSYNTFYNGAFQVVTFLYKGITQAHKGLEVDFTYKPIQDLELKGYGSFGSWEYVGNTQVTAFDEELNVVNSAFGIGNSVDVDGFKVGDAAQTTLGLGASYKFLNGFKVDADWNYFSNLYSDFLPSEADGAIQLPDYDLFDLGLSYKFDLTDSSSLQLRGNVNNLFDEVYLSDSDTNIARDEANPNNNYRGVNKQNSVYFGFGRTWNFGVTYKF